MSEKNNLPTKPQSKAVDLHDNGLTAGSLIEQSLSRLNHQQAQNLMEKAAEEGLRLEAKMREQNLDYVAGKKHVEDHIEAFDMLDKSGVMKRQKIVSDIKTGAGNMRIESKSGATCFVASAAYGNPNHRDVVYLRLFRDEVLSKTELGNIFIDCYWKAGPKLAKIVNNNPILKTPARKGIELIVSLIKIFYGK